MAGNESRNSLKELSLLMVGAGGIGCELLKNLVLTGFKKIQIIDLDTIDVSNLNRQFLFQRRHVGKSKAQVAKESVLRFQQDVDIKALHDSVMNPEYNVDFFSQFNLVMNALDNRAARNHVNRMCLAANIPLIESGTAGYLGQVTLIKKGETECYECQPKPTQKTFPGCTIRNTPSEPVHCIVWAKHLFNQLFGEYDADNEVSPDTEDPELAGNAGEMAVKSDEVQRVSTRDWAHNIDYDAEKLFTKFFNNDVKYLLSMEKLWQKREAPSPLQWNELYREELEDDKVNSTSLPDKQLWSISKCITVFQSCILKLKEKCKLSKEPLVWDKDDEIAMDFVTATANLRSQVFHIPLKSRFDVKSISGNIIPAIATTNAIIAGLMVVEALKILTGKIKDCRTIYLSRQIKSKNRLLTPCLLEKPNPKCYVCAQKPEVTVHMDVNKTTLKQLEEKLFKEKFGMIAPDVELDDGKGTILISSEEGETDDNCDKLLSDFNIGNSSRLKGDDFLQNYELVVNIRQTVDLEELFLMEGELPEVPKEEKPGQATTNGHTESRKRKLSSDSTLINGVMEESKKSKVNVIEEDDDIVVLST